MVVVVVVAAAAAAAAAAVVDDAVLPEAHGVMYHYGYLMGQMPAAIHGRAAFEDAGTILELKTSLKTAGVL